MSSSAPNAQRIVQTAVKQRQFAPVWYLHGEDDYLKEDAVRQLVDGAVDPATRDFNLEIRRGAELSGELLGSLLGTPPMMAERRVLVVRGVDGLKKDARRALDRYLAAPAPDAVVILVAPAGAKADKELVERAETIDFKPLTGDRIARWIAYHTEQVLGVAIEPAASALLERTVGPDLPQLALELEKLASYAGGGTITEAAVSDVVGVRHGETLGDFLDAILDRDAARALGMLPTLMLQPKLNAVQVVMALSVQMLAVGWARAQRDRGTPAGRLKGEIFGLLKEVGGVFTGRPWGEAADAWARAADRWPLPAVDAALATLLAADLALKESRLSSDEQLLATLALSLCGARAARAA